MCAGVFKTVLTHTLVIFLFGSYAVSDQSERVTEIEPSRNQILRLTDRGIEPAELIMESTDKILFFLNDSSESLTTLQIDFKGNMVHCHSTNLLSDSDGMIRSNRPFGPKDFATVCFHEPGVYPVKVFGLPNTAGATSAKVVVK